jgi:hypothetical protein
MTAKRTRARSGRVTLNVNTSSQTGLKPLSLTVLVLYWRSARPRRPLPGQHPCALWHGSMCSHQGRVLVGADQLHDDVRVNHFAFRLLCRLGQLLSVHHRDGEGQRLARRRRRIRLSGAQRHPSKVRAPRTVHPTCTGPPSYLAQGVGLENVAAAAVLLEASQVQLHRPVVRLSLATRSKRERERESVRPCKRRDGANRGARHHA